MVEQLFIVGSFVFQFQNRCKMKKKQIDRCKSASKYKGIKPPKCCGGNPCKACQEKYLTKPIEDFLREMEGQ